MKPAHNSSTDSLSHRPASVPRPSSSESITWVQRTAAKNCLENNFYGIQSFEAEVCKCVRYCKTMYIHRHSCSPCFQISSLSLLGSVSCKWSTISVSAMSTLPSGEIAALATSEDEALQDKRPSHKGPFPFYSSSPAPNMEDPE